MRVVQFTAEGREPSRAAAVGLLLRLGAIVALGIASLLFDGAPERYVASGPDLVPNLDFSDGARNWAGSRAGAKLVEDGEPGVVLWRDESQPLMPFVLRRLPLLEGTSFLRATVDVHGRDIVWLPGRWNRPNLHIEQFDANRRRVLNWPYRIASVGNGEGWQSIVDVVPISPRAAHMRFVAFMGARQGMLALRHLSIRPAVESRISVNISLALKLAWFGIGLACAIPLLGRIGMTRARLAVLTLSLGILAGSLAPQPEFNDWADQVKLQVKTFAKAGLFALRGRSGSQDGRQSIPVPPTDNAKSELTDGTTAAGPEDPTAGEKAAKPDPANPGNAAEHDAAERSEPLVEPPRTAPGDIGWKTAVRLWLLDNDSEGTVLHFLGYLLLAFTAMLAYRQWPAIFVVASAATLALATECLQSFVVTRDSEWLDLAANAGGITVGVTAALALMALARHWQRLQRT